MSGTRERLVRDLEPFAEAARQLRGWRLDYEPEPLVAGPPWNYEHRARELARRARCVLDLGTGGGEVFERIISGTDCRAVASEQWVVNAPVAAERLLPRCAVVRGDSLHLPFTDRTFDLVLSRHEEISPAEVARVLAPGGRFLTQQAVPDSWRELEEVFPDMVRFPDHFALYRQAFASAGFQERDAREFRRPVRFLELGHLVYNLTAAPWSLPRFSVRSHLQGLAELDRRMRAGTDLIVTAGVYLLEVEAPDSSSA